MEHKNPLFDLYEKLYFNEIDMREKLNARLQTPLALIVSLVGVLAFMLQNYERETWSLSSNASLIFATFLITSSVVLATSIVLFVRSWYGNTYSFLPSAQETEEYREKLMVTYAPYENGAAMAETYLNQYICRYYIECSSANTRCNDQRSIYLHKTNSALIVTVLLALIAFLSFYFGDLSKDWQKKPIEVKIAEPLRLQGNPMARPNEQPPKPSTPPANANPTPPQNAGKPPSQAGNPPPPPAPPPARQLREGVEIVKPGDKDGR